MKVLPSSEVLYPSENTETAWWVVVLVKNGVAFTGGQFEEPVEENGVHDVYEPAMDVIWAGHSLYERTDLTAHDLHWGDTTDTGWDENKLWELQPGDLIRVRMTTWSLGRVDFSFLGMFDIVA